MKRLIAFILVALAVLVTAGCGGTGNNNIPGRNGDAPRASVSNPARGFYQASFTGANGREVHCIVLTKEFSTASGDGGSDLVHALAVDCPDWMNNR